jgi:hypothetical protein
MSAPTPDPRIELARQAARQAALAAGCTCRPDIGLTELAPGISQADVRHDDHCRLLTRSARRSN